MRRGNKAPLEGHCSVFRRGCLNAMQLRACASSGCTSLSSSSIMHLVSFRIFGQDGELPCSCAWQFNKSHDYSAVGGVLTANSAEISPFKIAVWMARKFDPPPDTKMARRGSLQSSAMSGGLAAVFNAATKSDACLPRTEEMDGENPGEKGLGTFAGTECCKQRRFDG